MANAVVRIEPERFKQEVVLASAEIAKMLPTHVSWEKFQGMVLSVVTGNNKLLECTQSSLIRAVKDAASTGLSLDPIMREADILPIWSPGGMIAQCRPRAIGMMKLARQSGVITKIIAHEVYENDEFDVQYAPEEKLTHKPCLGGDRGGLTHAYCLWTFKDGTTSFEVIDQVRIDRAKASSEAYKYAVKENKTNTPWIQDEPEMWRKTAIRAASKYMPMSQENEAFLRALQLEDRNDEIDGEFREVAEGAATAEKKAPESGASQVKALEGKLGVGEPKASTTPETQSPTQNQTSTTGQPAAQGAAASTGSTASSASPPPSDTSGQGSAQSGGATTASPSRRRSRASATPKNAPPAASGPREEPPPPNGPEDYGRGANTTAQSQQKAQPVDDDWGDAPAENIDWKAEAHKMRADILNVGADLSAWKKFMEGTKPMRDKMKTGSPEWHGRIQTMILEKEEWFRSK